MKTAKTLAALGACLIVLSSCATEIISVETTLPPGSTTTTTIPTPEGDIIELLDQLDELTNNLGQEIVDGDREVFSRKLAIAQAILVVIEPQIRASGVDLLEDVRRIVGLIETATLRKRPADADKAKRFLTLIRESAPELLANS
jgi:hypothetical protein